MKIGTSSDPRLLQPQIYIFKKFMFIALINIEFLIHIACIRVAPLMTFDCDVTNRGGPTPK